MTNYLEEALAALDGQEEGLAWWTGLALAQLTPTGPGAEETPASGQTDSGGGENPAGEETGLNSVRRGEDLHLPTAGRGQTDGETAQAETSALQGGLEEWVVAYGGQGEISPLGELYRQTVRALSQPALGGAGTAAERTAPEPEVRAQTGLTLTDLDRTVRRDSRRYDGGMTIF